MKESKKLKWVVCGAGGIAGRKIVKDGLIAAGNCELMAVQSYPPVSAQEEGKRYKVPSFTRVEQMLDKVDCDAVYIATPQFLHLAQVKLAAQHGKHVFCEKPLATDVRDAEEIVRICKKAGVKLGTDFNYRFHPLHQKMRAMVKKGVIGEVVSGRCQFGQDFPPAQGAFRQNAKQSGGGAFADTGNHAADLLEYIMGRHTRSVLGIKRNTVYSYESEDSCAALLDFQEGGFGIVDAYFCSPLRTLRNDVEINGTKGTLHTGNTLQMKTTGKLVVRTEKGVKFLKCPNQDMYAIIFEKFTDAVLHGQKLPVTGEDGLHSQKIIAAVYRSSDTGRKIAIEA